MRAAVLLLVVAGIVAACGSAATTYSPQDVRRAFARQGIALERNRPLERRLRDAVSGGRGMIGSMLGRNVPVPERLFVASNHADLYVAVFPSPTRPRDVVGDTDALDAVRRQGLAISNRANVIAVADKSLERRMRAALKDLG